MSRTVRRHMLATRQTKLTERALQHKYNPSKIHLHYKLQHNLAKTSIMLCTNSDAVSRTVRRHMLDTRQTKLTERAFQHKCNPIKIHLHYKLHIIS